jgi:hypothetical protein
MAFKEMEDTIRVACDAVRALIKADKAARPG